jgi:hypothetical protein
VAAKRGVTFGFLWSLAMIAIGVIAAFLVIIFALNKFEFGRLD